MISFIRKISEKAGNIILNSSKEIVKEKRGGGNILLKADLESEKYILNSIRQSYPDHSILSEETYNRIRNPELINKLWIIDPLDGTTNASNGIPFFVVSVAYAERGIVRAAGIFDPNRNEFFSAEKGKGSYLNGKKITVSKKENVQGLIVDVGSPYEEENFSLTYPLGQKFHSNGSRIVNYGAAALECAWVACGRLDAFFEAGLKIWDIAAGQLIISEAGGFIIDPFDKHKIFDIFNQKAILASNKKIIKQLEKLINN